MPKMRTPVPPSQLLHRPNPLKFQEEHVKVNARAALSAHRLEKTYNGKPFRFGLQ